MYLLRKNESTLLDRYSWYHQRTANDLELEPIHDMSPQHRENKIEVDDAELIYTYYVVCVLTIDILQVDMIVLTKH